MPGGASGVGGARVALLSLIPRRKEARRQPQDPPAQARTGTN